MTDPSPARAHSQSLFTASLAETDPEIADAIRRELGRQRDEIELIASENIVSKAVLEAQGSVLTNKYAEGLPGRRYYGGCQYVDVAENLAIERVTKLFGCKFANVQPHSGASANAAAFMALMAPGDTFMGLNLAAGLLHDPDVLLLLYKLSRYTSSSLGTREALQLILSEVAAALQPDRALIAELQAGGGAIQCLAEFPIHGNAIRLSKTMIDWVLAERRALLTQDAISDRRLQKYGHPAKSVEEQKIHSAICVPLVWNSKIKGFLYMDTSTR